MTISTSAVAEASLAERKAKLPPKLGGMTKEEHSLYDKVRYLEKLQKLGKLLPSRRTRPKRNGRFAGSCKRVSQQSEKESRDQEAL